MFLKSSDKSEELSALLRKRSDRPAANLSGYEATRCLSPIGSGLDRHDQELSTTILQLRGRTRAISAAR
jgi:hypothetical protein